MPTISFDSSELDEATTLLQSLIRLDTTNPPGDEVAAIQLLEQQCKDLGLETVVVGAHSDRPNLVATFRADPKVKTGRPLVLSCHVDCVPADPDGWEHSPWSGHHDGQYIWGRGAIDMKGFAAMAFAVIAKLKREAIPLRRDLIFVAVSDEEAGTRLGSRWLVEEHPELLGSPEYVINEVGGFTVHRQGQRFYPVQVAEKGVVWLRLTVRGRPGHSSLPVRETTISRLAQAITAISKTTLPWHPSPEAKRYLTAFAKPQGILAKGFVSLMTHPLLTSCLLPLAVSDRSRRAAVEAVLRNTATPTSFVRGGSINTLPGTAAVEIDGRLAPGQITEDLLRELDAILKPILGEDYDLDVLQQSPPLSFSIETELYREIEHTLKAEDPEGHVVPAIIPGFTDSQNYARLGAQCYGFYPLQLPEDLDFAALFHGDNERIPVSGFHWGIEVLTRMLARFLTQ